MLKFCNYRNNKKPIGGFFICLNCSFGKNVALKGAEKAIKINTNKVDSPWFRPMISDYAYQKVVVLLASYYNVLDYW